MPAARHIDLLTRKFGNQPFRIQEAVDLGIPRRTLYHLRDRGTLLEVSRGVLQRAEADPSLWSDFAAASTRIPAGTICLNSALSYWDLTDELPTAVDVAVRRGTHPPTVREPAVHIHVFAAETFDLERQCEETETGERFWIYSQERSVVDAMRLTRYVGRDVALHALNRYMRQPGAEPLRLTALSRELGGVRQVSAALETILS